MGMFSTAIVWESSAMADISSVDVENLADKFETNTGMSSTRVEADMVAP